MKGFIKGFVSMLMFSALFVFCSVNTATAEEGEIKGQLIKIEVLEQNVNIAEVKAEVAVEDGVDEGEEAEGDSTGDEEEGGIDEEQEESVYDIRQRVERAQKQRYELLRFLAYIYQSIEDDEKAIDAYRKALEVEPSDRELIESLLGLYRKHNRFDDLIPMYEDFVIRYKGDNEQYFRDLIELYYRTNDDEKAGDTLLRYINEHGGKPESYFYAAGLLRQHGDRRRALEIVEQGIEKFPDNFDLVHASARDNMDLKNYSKALDMYEKAKEMAPSTDRKNEIERELSILYKKADIVKDVLERKTAELEKVEAELKSLYSKQGEMKEKAGKLKDALDAYRKLSFIAPDSVEGRMAVRKVQELEKKLSE